MARPLIVLGLDGVEPMLVARDPDRCPTLASMRRRGAAGTLGGLHTLLTDTAWPELRTGRSGVSTGHYYLPRQFRSGESRARMVSVAEMRPEAFYWNVAASHGLAVAVVDQPTAPATPGGTAVEISEWGTHDRFLPATVPTDPEAARLIRAAGPFPVQLCDADNDGSAEAKASLFRRVLAGIEAQAAVMTEMLERRDWDLFTAVLSAAHCAGHHFWPEDDAAGGLDPVETVYSALDRAVGRIIERAGADATLIVYSSHGMGPRDRGAALLPELIERMGLTSGRRRRRRLAMAVPQRVRSRLSRVVGTTILQSLGLTADRPIDQAGTIAVAVPNSPVGALRLSTRGRDPGGALEVGSADHRRVIADLRRELFGLRQVATGERPVTDVLLTDEVLGPDRHPDLPDLLVRFRRDLGIIGPCRSESLGTIVPMHHGHRTGEHGTPGAIWAAGPGTDAGVDLGEVATIDLAPTILARLGVAIPDWVEGQPIEAVVGR